MKQVVQMSWFCVFVCLMIGMTCPVLGDFYAVDCSGLMGDDGEVYYSNRYDGHARVKCGAPRWGFGGDSAYKQLPTILGPLKANAHWINERDPAYNVYGVYWIPAYVAIPAKPWWRTYNSFQGFFNMDDMEVRYREDVGTFENLVEVRLQSLPHEDEDLGEPVPATGTPEAYPVSDQSDGHWNFRVKKLVTNSLESFKYRINWSQDKPYFQISGRWVNKHYDDGFSWDVNIFRPVYRLLNAEGTPTSQWYRSERGTPIPYGTPVPTEVPIPTPPDDHSIHRFMYAVPLPTQNPATTPTPYQIEVSSQIPYTLEDLDNFLEGTVTGTPTRTPIPDLIDDVHGKDYWDARVRTIGYGGLSYYDLAIGVENNPIKVLEIDSLYSDQCVVIVAGEHYEPPGPRVMEGIIEEILDQVNVESPAAKWRSVDFALILMANPDAFEWGTCHQRPYGTKPGLTPPDYDKDLDLENGSHYLAIDNDGYYVQDDVEAKILQAYIDALPTSEYFRIQEGASQPLGTHPILYIKLHGDVCPYYEAWNDDENPRAWTRPPGNYGIAFGRNNAELADFDDYFVDGLMQNNPSYMRPGNQWMRLEAGFPWNRPFGVPGTGMADLLASVILEYDEVALYEDITAEPVPTAACATYSPEYVDGDVATYQSFGNTGSREGIFREFRVTCYHDDGTTWFKEWGKDVANAAANYVATVRPAGQDTPTPGPTNTPAPTFTPGGPIFLSNPPDYLL